MSLEAVFAALIPALVCGLALVASKRWCASAAGLALPLAYFLTHCFLLGVPDLDASAAKERLPWAALAFGLTLSVGGVLSRGLGRAALLLVCFSVAWWVTERVRANDELRDSQAQLLSLLVLLCFANTQLALPIARAAASWMAPLLAALVALFLAPSLVLGRSAVLAQLGGAVCAASVTAAIWCRFGGAKEAGALAATSAAPMIVLLAACCSLTASLDPWAAACFGVAPLLGALGLRSGGGWKSSYAIAAILLCSSLGLWLAYRGAPTPSLYDY